MVMLGYFVVIILDNLLVWHTNKTIAGRTSIAEARSDSDSPDPDADVDGSAGRVRQDGRGRYVKTNSSGREESEESV